MATWRSNDPAPVLPRVTLAGWVRVVVRGVPLATLVFGGLALLLLVGIKHRFSMSVFVLCFIGAIPPFGFFLYDKTLRRLEAEGSDAAEAVTA